jgi:hypothetical protein
MAATKLGLYNGALRILNERRLASLSEAREARRLLDDAYGDGSTNGAVRYCLEMGQWTFATRTVQIDYSPSVEPSFGYTYAFDQPSDLVRTTGIFEDQDCSQPLLQYADERRYWYAYLPTLYVKYVSNHATYGADLSLWPENFVKAVEAYLAMEIAGSLTGADSKVALAERAWEKAKKEARSFDAMNKPTAFMPMGSWNAARRGHLRSSRWDGHG